MDNSVFLKLLIVVCILFALSRLGEFVYQHVPPYSPGDCIQSEVSKYITLKIENNNILGGYSDVSLKVFLFDDFLEQKSKVSFEEQREFGGKKVKCE